jgi:hypothetical protein
MTSEQDKSHNKLHAINFLNNKVLPCFLDCKNKKIISDQAVFTYIATNFWKIPFIFNKEKYILYGYDFIGEADNSIESLSFFLKSNDKGLTDYKFEVLPISSEKHNDVINYIYFNIDSRIKQYHPAFSDEIFLVKIKNRVSL